MLSRVTLALAALTGAVTADIAKPASAAAVAGSGMSDWINAATQYGADPTGLDDSTSAIQNAMSAAAPGQVVYLPTGTYKVSAAGHSPAVVLRGDSGNTVSLTGYGTVIKPSTAWIQGSAAGPGVLLLLSQTAGRYSVVSEEQKIFDLMIDGSSPTSASVDGILVIGNVGSCTIQHVNISFVTGTGFHGAADSGGNPPSGVWEVNRLTVHRAGTNGISITATDLRYSASIADWALSDLRAVVTLGFTA